MKNKNNKGCSLNMNVANVAHILKVATTWTITRLKGISYRPEFMVYEWRYECGCYAEFGFGRN